MLPVTPALRPLRTSASLVSALAASAALAATAAACGADPDATSDVTSEVSGDVAPDTGLDAEPDTAAPFAFTGPCAPMGDGLCSVAPTPFVGSVRAIAAAGPDDVWFAGAAGLLARWDGAGFRGYAAAGAVAADYNWLAVVSPTCVWAAGPSAVARWDGASWTAMAAPPVLLADFDAASCDSAFAIGGDRVTLWGWQGDTWSAVLDRAELGGDQLISVAARDEALWVSTLGARATIFQRTAAGWIEDTPSDPDFGLDHMDLTPDGRLVLFNQTNGAIHIRDDAGWTRLPGDPPLGLALWMAADGDVWTVFPGDPLGSSLVSRWSGGAWTTSASLYRPVYGGSLGLVAVGGDDAGTVWVAGVDGGVARHDAGGWTTLAAGPPWPRTVGAQVGSAVWTAGAYGLVKLEGDAVTVHDLNVPGSQIHFGVMLVRAADDVWLAGADLIGDRSIVHWDGQTFTHESLPVRPARVVSLSEIDGALWAVAFLPIVPSSYAVYRRDGDGVWRPEPALPGGGIHPGWRDGGGQVDLAPPLTALAGPDRARLYGIAGNTVRRYDAGAWTVVHTLAESVQLTALAVDGDRVWVVGGAMDPLTFGQGVLAAFDGAVWSDTLIPGLALASGVFVAGGQAWVVGEGGAIIRVAR